MSAGVPVAPLVFGNLAPDHGDWLWLPHRSCKLRRAPDPRMQRVMGASLISPDPIRNYLFAGDAIFSNDSIPDQVKAAKEVLQANGIELAELTVDSHQRIVAVNPLPMVDKPEQVAKVIGTKFNDRLHSC